MQVLEEQEVKVEQVNEKRQQKQKRKRRTKKVSASKKAYLKRIKSTPYIENISIIDVWKDSNKRDRCHFCDGGDESLGVSVLPMIELCIPNYKMILRICNSCFERMNRFLLYQKRKIESYEKLVDMRQARHYVQSQEDWDSMTDEEKRATGCYGPAAQTDTGWEGALVRNNLRMSVNKDMYDMDTSVDARCPKCNHTWKCRSKLDFIQCANCRVISQREDIIVDRWQGQKLDEDLVDKRLKEIDKELESAGKL